MWLRWCTMRILKSVLVGILAFFLVISTSNAYVISSDPCAGEVLITDEGSSFKLDSACFEINFPKNYNSDIDFFDKYNWDEFDLKLMSIDDVNLANQNQKKTTTFASMGLTASIQDNKLRYISSDGKYMLYYWVDGSELHAEMEIDDWVSDYDTGILRMMTRIHKEDDATAHFTNLAPNVDGEDQVLNFTEKIVGENKFYEQDLYVGKSFIHLFLDPIYQADYSPIPVSLLEGGTIATTDDPDFDNVTDITSGMSDSSDGTTYETSIYIQNTTLVSYDDFESADFAGGTGWVANWTYEYSGTEIIFDVSSYEAYNGTYSYDIYGVGGDTFGSTERNFTLQCYDDLCPVAVNISFWRYLQDYESGEYFSAHFIDGDRSSTQIDYWGNGADDGIWHFESYYLDLLTYNLSGVLSVGFEMFVDHYSDDGYFDDIRVTAIYPDYSNATGISGKWNVTYNPSLDWWLRLKKTSAGSADVTVFAYSNIDTVNATYNNTETFAGTGWFNIDVNDILAYEENVAGLESKILRFSSTWGAEFSEMFLRAEGNDTIAPVITNCSVNDTTLGNNEIARFQCNVTDDIDVYKANGTIEGTVYDFVKENDWYYYNFQCSDSNPEINWTFFQVVDLVGNYSSTDPSLSVECIFSAVVTIVSPQNISYDSEIIDLNVSTNGFANTWWYSLNAGANVTFVPDDIIVADLGSNHLVVWHNDSVGYEFTEEVYFTVDSYGTSLNCFAVPDEVSGGDSVDLMCNFTYDVNGSSVGISDSCEVLINTTVLTRRYTGEMDGYHVIYGNTYAGFTLPLDSSIRTFDGGAVGMCTANTSGDLVAYGVVSADNVFESLDGTHNYTDHNYTELLIEIDCDTLDYLFGVKGSFNPVYFIGNHTWQELSLQLLNVSNIYRGFVYGCPDCTGINGDAYYLAYDEDVQGYTYGGAINQTSDWSLMEHEHLQWLSFDIPDINMTYNASSGYHEYLYETNIWSVPQNFQSIMTCTYVDIEEQVDVVYFNVTEVAIPSCSIDSFISTVPTEYNQTFTWSATSPIGFLSKYVILRSGDTTIFETNTTGSFSVEMTVIGNYTIDCYVQNNISIGSSNEIYEVVNLELEIYYSPYVEVDDNTTIYAVVLLYGEPIELDIILPMINIDGSIANMTWNENISMYEVIWIPSTVGVYPFNVSIEVASHMVEDGEITVTEPFCINISIWNNASMSDGSEYKNEFAWIYATRVYDPTLRRLFGRDRFECPPQGIDECFWHGDYIDGTAQVCLYESGNYSFYIIGNNIRWEQSLEGGIMFDDCEFCPPVKVSQKFFYPLGNYYLDETENIDLYISTPDLYMFGAFFGIGLSWMWMGVCALIGILAFVFALKWSGSLKTAMAVLVLLPTIIYIIMRLTLFAG